MNRLDEGERDEGRPRKAGQVHDTRPEPVRVWEAQLLVLAGWVLDEAKRRRRPVPLEVAEVAEIAAELRACCEEMRRQAYAAGGPLRGSRTPRVLDGEHDQAEHRGERRQRRPRAAGAVPDQHGQDGEHRADDGDERQRGAGPAHALPAGEAVELELDEPSNVGGALGIEPGDALEPRQHDALEQPDGRAARDDRRVSDAEK